MIRVALCSFISISFLFVINGQPTLCAFLLNGTDLQNGETPVKDSVSSHFHSFLRGLWESPEGRRRLLSPGPPPSATHTAMFCPGRLWGQCAHQPSSLIKFVRSIKLFFQRYGRYLGGMASHEVFTKFPDQLGPVQAVDSVKSTISNLNWEKCKNNQVTENLYYAASSLAKDPKDRPVREGNSILQSLTFTALPRWPVPAASADPLKLSCLAPSLPACCNLFWVRRDWARTQITKALNHQDLPFQKQ